VLPSSNDLDIGPNCVINPNKDSHVWVIVMEAAPDRRHTLLAVEQVHLRTCPLRWSRSAYDRSRVKRLFISYVQRQQRTDRQCWTAKNVFEDAFNLNRAPCFVALKAGEHYLTLIDH